LNRIQRSQKGTSFVLDTNSNVAAISGWNPEASYYTWVDWFDTFGLGANVPIAMGNLNSSILPLVNGRFLNIVVPYPMGFFPKNVDGRIDDPNAGWKGRALWSTYGTRTMYHLEGGNREPAEGRGNPAAPRPPRALT
jgi:hypothetical protein